MAFRNFVLKRLGLFVIVILGVVTVTFLLSHVIPADPVGAILGENAPPELVKKYELVSRNSDEAQYFANVANVDSAVGLLMDKLESLGQAANTLVIFTSDNGPETLNRYPAATRSYGSPGKLKGMKLWTHEAGFRVPGILYWPGRVQAEMVSGIPVSSLDFLPTFCSLAGVDIKDLDLDGTDISDLFAGGAIHRTKPLLWCYYNALNDHCVAMREGDWKIMAKLRTGGGRLPSLSNMFEGNEQLVKGATLADHMLFNLSADPSETRDVSEANPGEFTRLRELLQDQYAALLDDSPVWSRKAPGQKGSSVSP